MLPLASLVLPHLLGEGTALSGGSEHQVSELHCATGAQWLSSHWTSLSFSSRSLFCKSPCAPVSGPHPCRGVAVRSSSGLFEPGAPSCSHGDSHQQTSRPTLRRERTLPSPVVRTRPADAVPAETLRESADAASTVFPRPVSWRTQSLGQHVIRGGRRCLTTAVTVF